VLAKYKLANGWGLSSSVDGGKVAKYLRTGLKLCSSGYDWGLLKKMEILYLNTSKLPSIGKTLLESKEKILQEKAVEATTSKKTKRGKNQSSPRSRKACCSIGTALLKSIAEIGTQRTMKSNRKTLHESTPHIPPNKRRKGTKVANEMLHTDITVRAQRNKNKLQQMAPSTHIFRKPVSNIIVWSLLGLFSNHVEMHLKPVFNPRNLILVTKIVKAYHHA
jgi:hypothetical protein